MNSRISESNSRIGLVSLPCDICEILQNHSDYRFIEIISVQKKPAISNEINPKYEGFKAEVHFNTAPAWISFCYD
jgi:hypothetical protein